MTLADVAIPNARSGCKPQEMDDSHDLILPAQPTGRNLWRFMCRVDGQEKKLAIGADPQIGASEARRRRDEARAATADPAVLVRSKVNEARLVVGPPGRGGVRSEVVCPADTAIPPPIETAAADGT